APRTGPPVQNMGGFASRPASAPIRPVARPSVRAGRPGPAPGMVLRQPEPEPKSDPGPVMPSGSPGTVPDPTRGSGVDAIRAAVSRLIQGPPAPPPAIVGGMPPDAGVVPTVPPGFGDRAAGSFRAVLGGGAPSPMGTDLEQARRQ